MDNPRRVHSLTNKQLFNFSENPRPGVVFIGVNYVTFVRGYDPSANLSGVSDSTQFCPYATNDFARTIPTCYWSVRKQDWGLNKRHVHASFRFRLRLHLKMRYI